MDFYVDIALPRPEALAAVGRVAGDWDASWSPRTGGGRLVLPVVAGLRRGVLRGEIDVRAEGDRTRVSLSVEETFWRVNRPAAGLLALGAVGALPVMLWPLDSRLLGLAPAGLVLMFLAWFVVASRLRSAGAEEFLEQVRLDAEARA